MEDFRILKLLPNTLQRAKKIEKVKKKNYNVIRILKQNFSFYSSIPNGGDKNCRICLKLV
jgi:hypothetical protein